jgi:lipopolysaccharide export system protein LptA
MMRIVVAAVLTLLLPAAADGQQPAGKTPVKSSRPVDDKSIKPAEPRRAPVTVDADRMEAFRKESLVIFSGSVVARQKDSVQYADRMEVYLDENGERVVRTVSTGNVRIITGDCRTGTARRAEYYDDDRRVELIGNARVWEADNVISGERITIFVNEDRSVVQGGNQSRVRAVFYPKDDTAQAPAGQPGCTR